jgi:KaiC/GvpD/RAD55 family RecA-like ATPase
LAVRSTDAIAKIDVQRARRYAQMVAPADAPEFDHDPDEVLIDLGKLDGRGLLTRYRERMSKYSTTPFDPAGSVLRFYPGGVSIWSGFPGIGKTTMLRQLICFLLQRDQKVFTASLEEHPEDQIARLIETAAGSWEPDDHQAQWFLDAFGERLRIWAKIGLAQHRKLLAVVRKLASEGVTHVFIDSLMKLDVSSQDFEAQRVFANLLDATAKQTGCHIHLVAHPKKPQASDQDPDMNDVAGAKELVGIADNVMFIRRRKCESASDTTSGVRIDLLKKRYGRGQVTNISGWFHQQLCQFNHEQFPPGPARYLPANAYAYSKTPEVNLFPEDF